MFLFVHIEVMPCANHENVDSVLKQTIQIVHVQLSHSIYKGLNERFYIYLLINLQIRIKKFCKTCVGTFSSNKFNINWNIWNKCFSITTVHMFNGIFII